MNWKKSLNFDFDLYLVKLDLIFKVLKLNFGLYNNLTLIYHEIYQKYNITERK